MMMYRRKIFRPTLRQPDLRPGFPGRAVFLPRKCAAACVTIVALASQDRCGQPSRVVAFLVLVVTALVLDARSTSSPLLAHCIASHSEVLNLILDGECLPFRASCGPSLVFAPRKSTSSSLHARLMFARCNAPLCVGQQCSRASSRVVQMVLTPVPPVSKSCVRHSSPANA